jgi:hypothetical protein
VISHYKRSSCWCIVVADDQRVDWVSDNCSRRRYAPVQYSRLGGNESLLQKALRRASRIAPTAQIIITALEEFRQLWEPLMWYIPPENKFVGDNRATSLLTSAAALLSIVAKKSGQRRNHPAGALSRRKRIDLAGGVDPRRRTRAACGRRRRHPGHDGLGCRCRRGLLADESRETWTRMRDSGVCAQADPVDRTALESPGRGGGLGYRRRLRRDVCRTHYQAVAGNTPSIDEHRGRCRYGGH